MSLSWLVGIGVKYSDGGAPAKLEKLSQAAQKADEQFGKLQITIRDLPANITAVGTASEGSELFIERMNRAMNNSGSAGTTAARGTADAAAGYTAAGNAAEAATAQIIAFNAALMSTPGNRTVMLSAGVSPMMLGPGTAALSSAPQMQALSGMVLGSQHALGSGTPAIANAAQMALPNAAQTALPSAMRVVGSSGFGPSASAGASASAGGSGAVGGGAAASGATGGGAGGRGGSFGKFARGAGAGGFIGGVGNYIGGGGGSPGGPGNSGLGADLPNAPGFVKHAAIHVARVVFTATTGLVGDALYEAGKLQENLTKIQVGTNASESQMKRVRQMSFDIANMTAQSPAQTAGVIGVMASSGINDVEDLLRTGKGGKTFAEVMAKFADVQYLKSGGKISFENSTKQGMILAHQYGAYSGDKIAPILDVATKASFQMPDDLAKFVRQSSYYAKLYTRFGVSRDESMTLGIWQDRMGGSSKGGTWLQDLLLNVYKPLKYKKKKPDAHTAAMEYFGYVDKHGNYDPKIFGHTPDGHPTTTPVGMLSRLNDVIERDRAKFSTPAGKAKAEMVDIQKYGALFGTQGARDAYMADSAGVSSLRQLKADQKRLPGSEKAQGLYMQNFQPQATRAWSNFQALITEIGAQALPGATKGLRDLGDSLNSAQTWLSKHADLELSIQRTIINGVMGVEKYILHHHRDMEMLGGDIAMLGRGVKRLAPDIEHVTNGIIGMYRAGHDLAKSLDDANAAISGFGRGIHDWIAHLLGAGDPNGPKLPPPHASLGTPAPPPLQRSSLGIPAPLPRAFPGTPAPLPQAGPSPGMLGSRRQHTRRVEHHHFLHGTDDLGHAFVRKVIPAIERSMTGSSDTRSSAGRSGTIHTSPGQSTILSIPQPHR